MAASPIGIAPATNARRRPLALTPRRIEANRRNAMRSTGPRSPEGKAKVARNAIKHGFFVAQERWSPSQHRDFEEILDGLRDDLQPQGVLEETCVQTMAQSYVRMAAMLRYENIAALKCHQQCEREVNERIAVADAAEAERLRAERDRLRRAGLWRPTIPGPREARAIIRYSASLDRAIRRATSDLEGFKSIRIGGTSPTSKVRKRCEASPNSVLRLGEGPRMPSAAATKLQKQTHYSVSPRSGPEAAEGPRMAPLAISENAKTNPLSSMFTGNRHARRRAKALARRR